MVIVIEKSGEVKAAPITRVMVEFGRGDELCISWRGPQPGQTGELIVEDCLLKGLPEGADDDAIALWALKMLAGRGLSGLFDVTHIA